MIRSLKNSDLESVMQIWLDTNIKAHNFISKDYWTDNFDLVKEILPQAEVYVYEDEASNTIQGFAGMTDNYIAGIFVSDKSQSKGIGTKLLNYVKNLKQELTLSVYQKNVRAVKFYKRENFEIQSANIDENTGEKELIMCWKQQINPANFSRQNITNGFC